MKKQGIFIAFVFVLFSLSLVACVKANNTQTDQNGLQFVITNDNNQDNADPTNSSGNADEANNSSENDSNNNSGDEPDPEDSAGEDGAAGGGIAPCEGFPEYVPCGTFLQNPTAGSMICPDITMALDNSPPEQVTLLPQNGGNEIFAVATGSGEGTLSLLDVTNEDIHSTYAGLLTNSQGESIQYQISYISDSQYLIGTLSVSVETPGLGTCTMERGFDGFKLD